MLETFFVLPILRCSTCGLTLAGISVVFGGDFAHLLATHSCVRQLFGAKTHDHTQHSLSSETRSTLLAHSTERRDG